MGQTLMAVLDPALRFDRIVCFEPAPPCWARLAALADDRVEINHFGLWKETCQKPIFDPGGKGAGLWKKDNGRTDATEVCRFVRASEWMSQNIEHDDTVFLKLNVEGAECDIMDDLLDTCEFEKITYAMIDFDVRKIESQKHREAEIKRRLEFAGLDFPRVAFTKQVMVGDTHQARIKSWLRLVEPDSAV
jgi:FkbM family methyltransferase